MKLRTFLAAAIISIGVFGAAAVPVAKHVAHAQAVSPPAAAVPAAAGTPNAASQKSPTTNPQVAGTEQFNGVTTILMSIFAWFLGVAAVILEYAVYYTVVKMGDYIHGLSAVAIVWRVLRDMGNIVLIFGFVAIGIQTIIDANFYGNISKRLPMLLIVAVLLNFSLFFTEAIIDTGNLFAVQFYAQINGGSIPVPQSMFSSGTIANEGLSSAILARLKLAQLYGDTLGNVRAYTGQVYVGVLGSILFIVAAFVMLSLAFILISRFVTLIFLIVVAPIGFAGLVVPKLESVAQQWWNMLVKQTLTAPVLLLMLYIALRVILDDKFLTGFGNGQSDAGAITGFLSGSQSGLAGFGSMMLSFIVAMGLLVGVTVLAKMMSAKGAGWSTSVASKLTFGLTALGMSASVGSVGAALLNNKRMQSAASGKGMSAAGARFSTRLGRNLFANRTFDVRNIPGVAGNVPDVGTGNKITTQQVIDNKFGKKWFDERAKKEQEGYQLAKRDIDFADAQKDIEAQNAQLTAKTITPEQYEANTAKSIKVLSDGLSKMSTKQLEELGGIKKGVSALVTNLSPQQFDALMKSDKLSAEEHEEIRKARFAAINALFAKAATSKVPADLEEANKELAKMSTKEIVHGGAKFLTSDAVAVGMTNDQYDALAKDGVLTSAEKNRVDILRKGRFDVTTPNMSDERIANVAAAIKSLKWNRDQINKLPPDTITNTAVLDALKADALNLIDTARRGNLSPVHRQLLGEYLEKVAKSTTDERRVVFATYMEADPRVKRDLLIK